jgi:hypothetical protein
LSIAFPIARDPTPIELAQSKGEKDGYSKDSELDRLATNNSTSRPALTPHLKYRIARAQANLEELPKLSIFVHIARDQEPL